LRETYNENGVFITTIKKNSIAEPTGELTKYAKGDAAITAKLIADEMVTFNKQKRKLEQDNISMIPVILQVISNQLHEPINTMSKYKTIIQTNDPYELYQLISSVYLYNSDKENVLQTFHIDSLFIFFNINTILKYKI
jgi:hypothetical protein